MSQTAVSLAAAAAVVVTGVCFYQNQRRKTTAVQQLQAPLSSSTAHVCTQSKSGIEAGKSTAITVKVWGDNSSDVESQSDVMNCDLAPHVDDTALTQKPTASSRKLHVVVDRSTGYQARAVWRVCKDTFVISECCTVLLAQLARATVDLLLPLAMHSTATWLVGVVFIGEAAGAVIAPFLIDVALLHRPHTNTRLLLGGCALFMAAAACLMLVWNESVAAAIVLMFVFGAGHSSVETLAYNHLAEHVGADQDPVTTNATMCAFSLFYVSGFTAGAYVAGMLSFESVNQQRITSACVGLGLVLYILLQAWLLRRGSIKPNSVNVCTQTGSQHNDYQPSTATDKQPNNAV